MIPLFLDENGRMFTTRYISLAFMGKNRFAKYSQSHGVHKTGFNRNIQVPQNPRNYWFAHIVINFSGPAKPSKILFCSDCVWFEGSTIFGGPSDNLVRQNTNCLLCRKTTTSEKHEQVSHTVNSLPYLSLPDGITGLLIMADEARILGRDTKSSGHATRGLLRSSLSFLGPGFSILAMGPSEVL